MKKALFAALVIFMVFSILAEARPFYKVETATDNINDATVTDIDVNGTIIFSVTGNEARFHYSNNLSIIQNPNIQQCGTCETGAWNGSNALMVDDSNDVIIILNASMGFESNFSFAQCGLASSNTFGAYANATHIWRAVNTGSNNIMQMRIGTGECTANITSPTTMRDLYANSTDIFYVDATTPGDKIIHINYSGTQLQNWNVKNVSLTQAGRGLAFNGTRFYYREVFDNDLTMLTFNRIPVITSLLITPNPANSTNNLTCNYTSYDNDSDTLTATFEWFKNGVDQDINNQILRSGNLTGSDKWSCSLYLNDSHETSENNRTSNLTIGDSTAPVLNSSRASVSSAIVNDVADFFANCSDAGSSISSVKIWLYTWADSGNTFNSNITASVTNAPEYKASKSLTSTGAWGYRGVWCEDTSGNIALNTSVNINVSVNAAPSGGGSSGGGGGGGETVIQNIFKGNTTPALSFSIPILTFTVFSTPKILNKDLLVSNLGNDDFEGKIIVGKGIDNYISASICERGNLADCSPKKVVIKAGESKILRIILNATKSIDSGTNGVIRLSGDKSFELPIKIERLPGYKLQKYFTNTFCEGDEKCGLISSFTASVIILFGSLLVFTKLSR